MKTAIRVIIYTVASLAVFILSLVIYANHKEDTRVKQQAQAKPAMPILIKYRKALLASSLVTTYTNTSNRTLQVVATFSNPTTNAAKSFTMDIDPKMIKEFGYAQGWAFHSGDKILLHHADYLDQSVQLP